jgi:hypothetical protein
MSGDTALKCVQNEELEEQWERYRDETQRHVEIVRDLCAALSLDPDKETPGRRVVRDKGQARHWSSTSEASSRGHAVARHVSLGRFAALAA